MLPKKDSATALSQQSRFGSCSARVDGNGRSRLRGCGRFRKGRTEESNWLRRARRCVAGSNSVDFGRWLRWRAIVPVVAPADLTSRRYPVDYGMTRREVVASFTRFEMCLGAHIVPDALRESPVIRKYSVRP